MVTLLAPDRSVPSRNFPPWPTASDPSLAVVLVSAVCVVACEEASIPPKPPPPPPPPPPKPKKSKNPIRQRFRLPENRNFKRTIAPTTARPTQTNQGIWFTPPLPP